MKDKLMLRTLIFSFMCVVYLFTLTQVSASTIPGSHLRANDLQEVQSQWLNALESKQSQPQRFTELQSIAKKMFKLSLKHPQDAELKAWSGVMLSSFAGARKAGGGEHIAFFAQRMLENAEALQMNVLDESRLESGISAREALKKALAYNPSGLNPDLYYSTFLRGEAPEMLAANTANQPGKTDNSSTVVTQAIN
ncbi:hypothetical protein A9Q77_01060 [Marinomonas sp. 42_23_T18]|nr:hypothetical protein A9Q77_01060 [Marinomonas sp. 42_23_T18]